MAKASHLGPLKSFTAIDNNKGALYFIHRAQRSTDTQALAYFCAGEESTRVATNCA
ncbi:MAG: hypothetical protein ABI831_09950 [Betaproteobacteria bacterium]